MRWFPARESDRVTIPDPGDDFRSAIPVDAILAYEAADVLAPFSYPHLVGRPPYEWLDDQSFPPINHVKIDGEWHEL